MRKLLALMLFATLSAQAQMVVRNNFVPDVTLSRDLGSGALWFDSAYVNVYRGATLSLTGNASVGGTLGVTGVTTLTGGLVLPGTAANISLGSNFISNGGTDAGFSLDASNNATLSGNLNVSGQNAAIGAAINTSQAITIESTGLTGASQYGSVIG